MNVCLLPIRSREILGFGLLVGLGSRFLSEVHVVALLPLELSFVLFVSLDRMRESRPRWEGPLGSYWVLGFLYLRLVFLRLLGFFG